MTDKALLCGINSYQAISRLRGCLNDVANVRTLLTESCGFGDSRNEMKTLQDAEVTKDNLREGWRWLLQGAKPGERRVFHFSGHGSYVRDENNDEDDGADELLCLYDMDWSNPESYLLDDDLAEWTQRLPSGVLLTIILDSCHSGTATRMLLPPTELRTASMTTALPLVDMETTLRRMGDGSKARTIRTADVSDLYADLLKSPSEEAEQQRVLVRFVPPPEGVVAAVARAGVRSGFRGQGFRDAPLNHVLLAGSQSDQTSADAFIDGDYHGAFSFHFCKTVRKSKGRIEHTDLIDRIRTQLKKDGFSQVPQLEPDSTAGPLFRQSAADVSESPEHDSADPADELEGGGSGSSEAQSDGPDLVTGAASASLPGTTAAIPQAFFESLSALLATYGLQLTPMQRSGGARALVYVHGICKHSAGYSDPWWAALAPHLPAGLRVELESNRHEVLWSDIVTRDRSLEAAEVMTVRAVEQQQLAAELRAVLEDRAERDAAYTAAERGEGNPSAAAIAANRAVLGIPGVDCVDDFTKYLLSDAIRERVLDRFRQVIHPLLAVGTTVDVISHSWGTVVAYEALCALPPGLPSGTVANFLTVGSALSIGPVKRRLRPATGIRPPRVRRWINLDAQGDVVGGPLKGRPFQVDAEFLDLAPTGCDAVFGIVSPACAHSSYFDRDNDAVNGGVFARFMGE